MNWPAKRVQAIRTRSRLFALAYAELRHYDDAHDAVAAALFHICVHVQQVRQPERIDAWMNSVVRNEVRQLRRVPEASLLRLENMENMPDVVAESEATLLYMDIEQALRRLPARHSHALRLFYLSGFSICEIAQQTTHSTGS